MEYVPLEASCTFYICNAVVDDSFIVYSENFEEFQETETSQQLLCQSTHKHNQSRKKLFDIDQLGTENYSDGQWKVGEEGVCSHPSETFPGGTESEHQSAVRLCTYVLLICNCVYISV